MRDHRSIFLGDVKKIRNVYRDETLDKLKSEANLETDHVYTKEEIISSPQDFHNVTYIFSTWGMTAMTKDEIAIAFPSLKAVFYAAGTVQYFAVPFLESGISVFSAWAANAVPVAEYTTAQIVLANKGFFSSSRIYKSERSKKAASAVSKTYLGNYNNTVGLIGCGMIGSMVAERLKCFNTTVLAYDPFMSQEKASCLGVKKVSLCELFADSNVISNHLANNPQTVGMLDYSLFSTMKHNAVFINTGRGAQVVEKDLIRVLSERKDITAVLDVTMPEPPNIDSELFSLDNVVLTPHIAGSSGNEVCRMAEYMLEEFRAFSRGEKTSYSVALKMLETMA